MAWHEAMREPTRRGMVRMMLGQQADASARTAQVYRVTCTPADGRRYSTRAVERQVRGSLIATHVVDVQNLRCDRGVR